MFVSLPVSIATSSENIFSDVDFNIYPNPTNSTTTLFLNLESKKKFQFLL